MSIALRAAASVMTATCFAGCAGLSMEPRAPVALPLPEWERLFKTVDPRWRGADAAYSVELAPGRVLWLFGDTWITAPNAKGREGGRFVRNTIAIQEIDSGRPEPPDFYWTTSAPSDAPAGAEAAFVPAEGPGWLWPLSGLMLDGRLVLFMSQLISSDQGLGFEAAGNLLVLVENPADPPEIWTNTQHPIPWFQHSNNGDRVFGCANIVADTDGTTYIYVYGVREDWRRGMGGRDLIVARTTPGDLLDARFDAWEFFDGAGWMRDVSRAAPLFDEAASEKSVHYDASLRAYVAVYTRSGLSDEILARFAPRPEGPWSEPQLLYRCPEVRKSPDYFCYAAKAHPEFPATDGRLIVTYASNSFRFTDHLEDTDLYWPHFIGVRLNPRQEPALRKYRFSGAIPKR